MDIESIGGTSIDCAVLRPPSQAPLALRIIVADETELYRDGVKAALHLLGQPLTVIDANTWAEVARECSADVVPDLLLIDEEMAGLSSGDGLAELTQRLPSMRVVIVTGAESGTHLRQALRLGARGYLSKKSNGRLLVNAIQLVLDGGIYASPDALLLPEPQVQAFADDRRVAQSGSVSRSHWAHGLPGRLTARQMEVLEQLMKGHSNKVICRELGMAMGTVKSHIAAIFSALQVSSRTAAIAAVARFETSGRTPDAFAAQRH